MAKESLFIITKYVRAKSASDAIRKEKDAPVFDVRIDDEWRRNQTDRLAEAIGFIKPTKSDE